MKSIQIKSTSISLVLLALGFANVMAQAPDDPGVDENDVNVRENPIIDGVYKYLHKLVWHGLFKCD